MKTEEKIRIFALLSEIQKILKSADLNEGDKYDHDRSLTRSDVMYLLNISRATLYRLRKEGYLPYKYDTEGHIFFDLEMLFTAVRSGRISKRIKGFDTYQALERIEAYRSFV